MPKLLLVALVVALVSACQPSDWACVRGHQERQTSFWWDPNLNMWMPMESMHQVCDEWVCVRDGGCRGR